MFRTCKELLWKHFLDPQLESYTTKFYLESIDWSQTVLDLQRKLNRIRVPICFSGLLAHYCVCRLTEPLWLHQEKSMVGLDFLHCDCICSLFQEPMQDPISPSHCHICLDVSDTPGFEDLEQLGQIFLRKFPPTFL